MEAPRVKLNDTSIQNGVPGGPKELEALTQEKQPERNVPIAQDSSNSPKILTTQRESLGDSVSLKFHTVGLVALAVVKWRRRHRIANVSRTAPPAVSLKAPSTVLPPALPLPPPGSTFKRGSNQKVDAAVTVKLSVRDRIRKFETASTLKVSVDMHGPILKSWSNSLNAWIRFMTDEAKSENLLKNFPPIQFRAIGILFSRTAEAKPYLCVTGLTDEASVEQMHTILSTRKYRKRYKNLSFCGVCYTLDKGYSIELASSKEHISMCSASHLTLCGAFVSVAPDGLHKSFTIGGVVQVGNSCFALTAGHIHSTPIAEALTIDTSYIDSSIVADMDLDDDADSAIIVDHWNLPADVPIQTINKRPPATENALQDGPTLSRTLGKLIASGVEWSLISIVDDTLRLPNVYEGPNSFFNVEPQLSSVKRKKLGERSDRKYLSGIAQEPAHRTVHILAGRSGRCVGLLSPNRSYLHLPSGEWVQSWMVHFDAAFGKLV